MGGLSGPLSCVLIDAWRRDPLTPNHPKLKENGVWQSSSRGEKLRNINAVPAKEILRNKAGVCSPLPAICEILDNIFDNFAENRPTDNLSISIDVQSDGNGQITISENSGGISEAKLEPLVRLGVAYHAAKGSIGTWGEGFKVAAFSLGREVEVITHYPDERPVVVYFDENWLSSSDWNVPLFAAAAPPERGSTVFRIRGLVRKVDWTDVMRNVSVIYGHKILAIKDAGKSAHIGFTIDGNLTRLRPLPVAAPDVLRARLSYVPDFSPRQFLGRWRAGHGIVNCKLIVGLTPRNSQFTSGVYLFGNGRMFARALRSRAVGYGETGNAILRDHPTCWRIHAYAFFEADDGTDIPWQAPLKDGVAENHPITAEFRNMLRSAVAPYSRFAKVAKASDLVPFSAEWSEFTDEKKAEILFGSDELHEMDLFRQLPVKIRDFSVPDHIEDVQIASSEGQVLLSQLDQQAKLLRQVILRRDSGGPDLETDVLRILYSNAFSDDARADPRRAKDSQERPTMQRFTIELESSKVKRLITFFGASTAAEAVRAAIAFVLKNVRSTKVHIFSL